MVLPGADPSGDTSTSATLPVWAQIESMIGSLDDLTTEAKNNLVDAINEAAQSGGGSASISMRVDGGYIQYSTDNGNTWVNLIAKAELKGDKGDTGSAGANGKSAYQYAVEGGYTGTEAEFAEKLAQEQLTGTTAELTPTQVYNAVSAGIPVKVQYTDRTYGLLSFTAFNIAESLSVIVAQAIVYYNSVYILAELGGNIQAGNWFTEFTVLAEKSDIPDIPMAIPNPHAITFTGAVTGNYDGSFPMNVNIPSAVTDDHINSLIDAKLGVIENGSY